MTSTITIRRIRGLGTCILSSASLMALLVAPALGAVPCEPRQWCRKISHSQPTELAGAPHRVLEVRPARPNNEYCFQGTMLFGPICKYSYKIVLQRPGRDIAHNSSGILPVYIPGTRTPSSGHRYVLDYEVSTVGWGGAMNFNSTRFTVLKRAHPDPRKIILYLREGLEPGTYFIRVALNAVFQAGNLQFSLNFLDRLKSLSPIPGKVDAVVYQVMSALKAERISKADVFRLIVPARMPVIKGLKKNHADERLKARWLKPNPQAIDTHDAARHRRVIKQGKPAGHLLPAGTLVPYKYWRYSDGGQIRPAPPQPTADGNPCPKDPKKWKNPVKCLSW